MPTTQGLFVTGTDTGVGKTLVACAIIRLLRETTLDAIGFKPVATGEVDGSWGDAVALHEASECSEPIERICPLRFALPLAPTLAARAEGIDFDLNLARNAFVNLCNTHSCVVVEGVGGLLSPLDNKTLVVDLAVQIGFPVLVVARGGLGTISQTLLTLRELARANLRVAGIIMNITRAEDTGVAAGSKEEIERISGQKVLATLPFFGADGPDAPRTAAVARAVAELSAQQLNIRKLLGDEGRSNANLKRV